MEGSMGSPQDPINDYRSKDFQAPSQLDIKNLAGRMQAEGMTKEQASTYIDGLFDGAPHGSALTIKQQVLSQFTDVQAPKSLSNESSPGTDTMVASEEEVPLESVVDASELGEPDEQVGMFGPDDDEMFGILDSHVKEFVNNLTANEVGTGLSFIKEGFGPVADEMATSVTADAEQTGMVDVYALKEEEKQGLKASFGILEGDPVQTLEAIQEEVDIIDLEPEILTVYKGIVERLRAEGVNEKALELVTAPTELYKQRHLEQIYSKAQMEVFNDASVFEIVTDFSEAIIDVFGVLDRSQRRNVVSNISGEFTDNLKFNFLRSSDIRDIVDEKWEQASFEDQRNLILQSIQAVKSSDTFLGNHNTMYSADVLMELEDALSGEYGATDWVSWLEATGVAAPVARLVKQGKNLVKVSAIKMMKARDVYYGIDVTDEAEDILNAMDEWIRLFDPEADVANNLRIEGEAVQTKVLTPEQELQEKVSTFREAASTKMSRGDRKALEQEVKGLEYELSIDRITPESVRTDNMTKRKAVSEAKKQEKARKAELQKKWTEAKDKLKQDDVPRAAEANASRAEQGLVPLAGSTGKLRFTGMRMGNSTVGNLAQSISPSTLARIINGSNETPEQILTRLGMDTDNVMLSTLPSMADEIMDGVNPALIKPKSTLLTSDIRGRKTATEIYQTRPLDQVIRPDEIQVGRLERLGRIVKLSGDSLSLHADKSRIQVVPGGMRISGRFGATDELGFSSFDEAELAAKNMVGEQYEIVYKVPNRNDFKVTGAQQELPAEYFVQVKYDRQFTAKDALSYSDASTKYNSNVFTRLFSTYSDRIDKEIINNVSVLRDYDIAVANRLQETLKPYSKTTGLARVGVNYVLTKGDANQVSYTLGEVSDLLMEKGLIIKSLSRDSKEWKAYRAVREFYSDLADIKDIRVRAELEEQGFKNIIPLREGGNNVYGVPKTLDEIKSENIKQVYDTRSGLVVNVADLSPEDGVSIVRLKSRKEFPEAGKFQTVLVANDKIEPLPQNVIARREGYLNREYKDVGAKISVVGPETVDGVYNARGSIQTVRFGKDIKEVNKWLDEVAVSSGKTNRELLQEGLGDGFELQVDRTREDLFSISEISTGSGGNVTPYNLRSRGDAPIEGVRGAVELFGVEGSLTKSLRGIESTLNKDAISIMKRRWLDQYGQFMDMKNGGYTFPEADDLSQGVFRSKDTGGTLIDEDTIRNATNLHSYIKAMETMAGFKSKDEFDDFLSTAINWMTKGNTDRTPLETVKFAATAMVIYGRPIFQILGNALQVLMLVTRDPLRGTASIAESVPILAILGGRKSGVPVPKGAEAVLAKLAGFKNLDEFDVFYKALETSGVFTAAKLDNLLSNITSGRTITETRLADNTLNLAAVPFNIMRGSQSMATDLSNLVAFRHALKLVPELHKGVDPFSRSGLTKANTIMRELTFRMNKTDVLSSETNPIASLALMWTQHVYKGWKDTILQPAVTAATFNRVKLAKNPSIWATDTKQAFISTAATLTMFGGAGIIPNNQILALDESARKYGILEPGETFNEIFYEGLIDKMMKEYLGIDVNVAERFSFSDAPTMIASLTGIAEGAFNIFGGSSVAFTRVGQLIQTYRMMDSDMLAEEGDLVDMLKFFGSEAASLFSGFSDYERFALAKNFGMYFTTNGNALYKVDAGTEFAMLASLRPDEAAMRERIIFSGRGTPAEANMYSQTIPRTFARWFWQNMTEKQREYDGNMPYSEYAKEIRRFYRFIDIAANSRGGTDNAATAKRAFFKLAVDPTGEFIEPDLLGKAQSFIDTITTNRSNSEVRAKLSQVISMTDDPHVKRIAEQQYKILAYDIENAQTLEDINRRYNVDTNVNPDVDTNVDAGEQQ